MFGLSLDEGLVNPFKRGIDDQLRKYAETTATSSFTPSNIAKPIPPPLAMSTPKKPAPALNKVNSMNGVNGTVSSKTRRLSGAELGSPKPKKRKVVHMDDDSDREDQGVGLSNGVASSSSTKVNGSVIGFVIGQKKKSLNLDEIRDIKAQSKFAQLQEQRKQLPIAKGRDALVKEIQENDTIILLGETGSGKTTQVPQYILDAGIAGSGMIAVTQPRRVAATSLAARVAQEQGTSLGGRVGYAVRFVEAAGPDTRIKYVTDGFLARERLADPMLRRYSVIIVDEAHERTLNTDMLIAGLRSVQRERREMAQGKGKGKEREKDEPGLLKIVIMSATLDADKFSRYFDSAKVLYVKGRQHPVKIFHTTTVQADYVDSALRTFFQIHIDQPRGDVLIFMPGQDDIQSLEKAINAYAAQLPVGQMRVVTYQLLASLPQSYQNKAFSPTPLATRKCIIATNIAETSITIPGIKYVIDSGKCKEKRHIAGATGGGMDTLLTQDICKSSAMQRTGRAGRQGPGFCFRLYTEDDFERLPVSQVPEIQRCSLTSSMLQLKCLGQDLEEMDFMDKPDVDTIGSALKSLYLLGAIDDSRRLTPIGRKMNNFPLDPPLARALLASKEYACTREVIGIVSVLSGSSKLFYDPPDEEKRNAAAEARTRFRHASGDHLTALAALRAYEEIGQCETKAGRREWCRRHFVNERTLSEAVDIQDQLRSICERVGIDYTLSSRGNDEPVLRSLLRGMAEHTALLRSEGGYKQIMGHSMVKIHPGSTLADRKAVAIMYDEFVFTGSAYVRGVSAIPPALLSELPVLSIRKAG